MMIKKFFDRLSYHQSMIGGMTNLEKMRGDRASVSERACPQSPTGCVSEHFDKKIFFVVIFDIAYYLLLLLIIYTSFLYLGRILDSFQNSALAFGELGLIGDLGLNIPQDISKFQNAAKIFDASKRNLVMLAIALLLLASVLASFFKGLGYCKLLKEKFTFLYFKKALLFNLIWRGLFFSIFLLGFIIIKPEMLFWFWIILLVIFYYFTPIIYMNISTEKRLWKSIKNGFKVSMKKAHIILLSSILFIILAIAFYWLLRFLPNYVFYFVYFFVVVIIVGMMKVILVQYI